MTLRAETSRIKSLQGVNVQSQHDRSVEDQTHRVKYLSGIKVLDRRISVAPMMDWTDCHCRYVHRLFSPHALLYTEMIVSTALVRGDARRLLEHHPAEHPVALQLGGCDPKELAAATRIGAAARFAEINLNVGCPSDRVKHGSRGRARSR